MNTGAKMFVGFPTGGGPTVPFLSSLVHLAQQAPEIDFGFVESSRLVANRNRLCEMFLDSGRKYMVQVDDDMMFDPEDLLEAIELMEDQDLPLVGGLAFSTDGGQLFSTLMVKHKSGGYIKGGSWPERALQPVDASGAALIIVRRDLIEKMKVRFKKRAPYWWFEEIPRGDHTTGEDVTFWERAVELGIKPIVFTGLVTGHIKPQIITHHSYNHQLKDKGIILGPHGWWLASVFNRLKVPVRPPDNDQDLSRWRIIVPYEHEIIDGQLTLPREWAGADIFDTRMLATEPDHVGWIKEALRAVGVHRDPAKIAEIAGTPPWK